jgi:hypothetical protein
MVAQARLIKTESCMRLPTCLILIGTAFPLQTSATNPSALSEVSAVGVSQLSEATVELIAGGGKLVLTAASAGAEVGSLVISAVGSGASVTVQVSAATATEASALVGTGIEYVAASGGWILMMAGEAICFVPNEVARHHLHRRELQR